MNHLDGFPSKASLLEMLLLELKDMKEKRTDLGKKEDIVEI